MMSVGVLPRALPDAEGRDARVGCVRLMDAQIAAVGKTEAVAMIVDAAAAGRGHWTITANLDHIRRHRRNPAERALIDEADLVVADGMPLIWASHLAGRPLPERVAGSDMVWSICQTAQERGLSIFLLGGDPGVAERAAAIFTERYPGLQVVGTACPPVGFEHDQTEMARIRDLLAATQPQIVFVALGFPKQDLLIRLLRHTLPAASLVGVGIGLSYATGDAARAPEWVCKLGLEWAFRLWHEPRRELARRYLIDGLPFAVALMASAAVARVRRRERDVPTRAGD